MKYVTLQNVNMKLELYTLALLLVSSGINAAANDTREEPIDTETYLSRFIADLWLEGTDVVRIIWRDCSKKVMSHLFILSFTEVR